MSIRIVYGVIIKLSKVIWRNFEFVPCTSWSQFRLMDIKWQWKYVAVYVLRETGKIFKDVKTGLKFPSTSHALNLKTVHVSYSFCCMIYTIFTATVIIYWNSIGRYVYYVQKAQCVLWSVNSCGKYLYVSYVLCRIKLWVIRLESDQFCVSDSAPWNKNLGMFTPTVLERSLGLSEVSRQTGKVHWL